MTHRVRIVLAAASAVACGEPLLLDVAPTERVAPPRIEPFDVLERVVRAGEPCDAEVAWFEVELHAPILERRCLGCHQWSVRDARTAWISLAPSVRNGRLLVRVRGEDHPGGEIAAEGTRAYGAFERYAADVLDEACNDRGAPPPAPPVCSNGEFGPTLVRRLTHDEYDASVTALTGVTSTAGRSLAADPRLGGFDNHARALVVTELLADQVRSHAESIAERIAIETLYPCDPAVAGCRDVFVRTLGARAFRRPLTNREHARYVALFDATARGDFEAGARWVLTAMLQSPNFLYRTELGTPAANGTRRLTGWEIASELSYLLTGGPPDDALRAAAEAGTLHDPEVRVRHARRLRATAAGRREVVDFFEQWLALDEVSRIPKDPATYPELTAEVRSAMSAETERFVTRVLEETDGTISALFTTPHSAGDRSLARYYGSPAPRAGLLQLGSLLSVHARPNDASPVRRGALVRRRLMCESLPLPPPDVAIEPPPLDPSLSTRERYEAITGVEPCRSCHRLMDPIGFAFGEYDGIGRRRFEEAGRPIDTRGEIVSSASSDGTFDGVDELAALLASSPDVHRCFSSRVLRHAYGLDAAEGLSCALERAHDEFVARDLRIEALLDALVRGEHFVTRRP